MAHQEVPDGQHTRTDAPDVVSTRPVRRRSAARVRPGTRLRVLERDGYRCLACGTTANLTMDHIVPASLGGRGKQKNLQTLCHPCNRAKGLKTTNYRRRARELEMLGTLLDAWNANGAASGQGRRFSG